MSGPLSRSLNAARRLAGRWRPALHWPSVRGRARADAGPLLLAATVVAAVTVLAGAVPPLLRAAATAAVQDAVLGAGPDADILVSAPWEPDDGPSGGRLRQPHLAEELDGFRDRAAAELSPGLRSALRPPVTVVTSPSLKVTTGSVPRTFRLTYLAGGAGRGPRVTWLSGGPPRPTIAAADDSFEAPIMGPPWPVQVGLSESDAAALKLRPGARIALVDNQHNVKNVQVSGIFRAMDGADPVWRLAPWLLHPVPGADGVGTSRLAGLLSADSLPDARLAFTGQELPRTVRFSPNPGTLSWDAARSLAATVVALKAASGSSSGLDASIKWDTLLDGVLRKVRSQVEAASAQASVLLTGILAAAVLVLLLAAELLVRRRTPALTAARQRGAALPDLGLELLLESAGVGLAAAAAGLALARALTPGVSWGWALPVTVAAVAAGPAFGTLAAARATRDRRLPANRAARRWAQHTGQLRRASLEAAVLLACVIAFVALHQRGIVPDGQGADGALQASAPTLGALAGAVVLLRLLPAATRQALRQALRSGRALALFGTARAAATSARVLPLLVLLVATALASFALTLRATASQGLADGAWRTVGADARLDILPAAESSTAALAQRAAAAPGVRQAVAGQVTDRSRVVADSLVLTTRLVIVDAAAFQRLLAATALPDAPELSRLAAAGRGDLPALVRSGSGRLRPGIRLRLQRDGAPAVPLTAVGTAPAVGDTEEVVLVDAAAAAGAGLSVVPNTIWVSGPGAARAVATPAAAGNAVLLTDVLRSRREAPLTAGLLRLAWAGTAILAALGLLGLALGAAAGAPDRWLTLTRLRTLGLYPREARRVAAWELLPPVVAAAVAGPLLGALLARLTLGPLALRQLTDQATDPVLAVPWWWLGLLAVSLPVAVAVLVPVESAVRRRRRLGDVLRAGGG